MSDASLLFNHVSLGLCIMVDFTWESKLLINKETIFAINGTWSHPEFIHSSKNFLLHYKLLIQPALRKWTAPSTDKIVFKCKN